MVMAADRGSPNKGNEPKIVKREVFVAFDDILQELSGADRTRLLDRAEPLSFAKEEVLIKEGEANAVIYIILDGEVRVEKQAEDTGKTVQLAMLGFGSIFGEMSFLGAAPASATVVANEAVDALCIEHAHLNSLVKQDPAFSGRFYQSLAVTLAQRLREMNRRTS
jgi:extracellular factor (EF) 3-hydroxypalmitic acid methyl ester biosynthesis protein